MSLIEVLIVVGVLGIIGAALIRLGTTSLTTSDSGRQRAVATQLADEALEALRAFRDTNTIEFFCLQPSYRSYSDTGDSQMDGSDFPETDCGTDRATFDPNVANGCQVTGNGDFYRVIGIATPNGVPSCPDSPSTRVDVAVHVFWNQKGTWSEVTTASTLTHWR